jgi:hypothetical protein
MPDQENLLTNPYFRYGQAATSALVIAALAILVIDDGTVRAMMLLVAALDLVVTPAILKRVGEDAATGTGQQNL